MAGSKFRGGESDTDARLVPVVVCEKDRDKGTDTGPNIRQKEV